MSQIKKSSPVQSGEASTVSRPALEKVAGGQTKTWPGKPATYYGNPLIKKAGWRWQIILYFFLGGIAGGSYLVATLADLLNIAQKDQLVRSGRYLSFVCVLASPVLLIWDLGKPTRFHHMLRIFKLRSVMSLGTWALSAFGLCSGLTTAHQAARDGLLNWFPLLARLLKALPIKVVEGFGSLAGLFVASYTGVLLSSTAVPLWGRAKHILGPLFLTSALSTGMASLSVLLSLNKSNKDPLERLERAELIAMTAELGLISTLPPTLKSLGKPLFTGKVGASFRVGTVGAGLLIPLLTRLSWKLTRRPLPHTLNIVLSLLVLVGGFLLRYEWIVAGRASADDPEAVHLYNSLAEPRRK